MEPRTKAASSVKRRATAGTRRQSALTFWRTDQGYLGTAYTATPACEGVNPSGPREPVPEGEQKATRSRYVNKEWPLRVPSQQYAAYSG